MASSGEVVSLAARRGRPRSEETRAAILRAAGELLLDQDINATSMDAVAERAGASKATIYRWWPSKELLALDALFSEWDQARPDVDDTGSLAGDLLALVLPWTRQLESKPYGRVIAAFLVRAQNDPEFAEEFRDRVIKPRRGRARAIFADAIERGEIPADTDIEAAIDLVYGPFYLRLLQEHAPLGDDFARTVVDYVVAATSRSARRLE
jgi:AcrR family transcriptional regulator